jgi:hypothetical protein
MRTRITKVAAGLTAVAALAIGGATFASAASKTPPAKAPPVAVDRDNVRQGDQKAPDSGTASEQSKESASDEAAGEQAGESRSEVVADDGPGGHADEPANPNADYQFEGQQ